MEKGVQSNSMANRKKEENLSLDLGREEARNCRHERQASKKKKK